jgi:NAD(P)-dependent dehydrogenase (short-subunit alcohol dehydrogenase family)
VQGQRVAIVTAAGKGIGMACACELAARGYALALMSPSGSSSSLAKKLGGIGLDGSVTTTDDLKRLVDMTLQRWGRVDSVVNNTGNLARITPGAKLNTGYSFDPHLDGVLLDIADEEWHASVDFYLLSSIRMARLVTPVMVRQGGGTIVNISSLTAREPRLSYAISTPARAALSAFTKMFADRYAREKVRMNTVLPGFMENRQFPDSVLRSIPMARTGRLQELARTVAFLLSDDSGYITGQSIQVDGGANRAI